MVPTSELRHEETHTSKQKGSIEMTIVLRRVQISVWEILDVSSVSTCTSLLANQMCVCVCFFSSTRQFIVVSRCIDN